METARLEPYVAQLSQFEAVQSAYTSSDMVFFFTDRLLSVGHHLIYGKLPTAGA